MPKPRAIAILVGSLRRESWTRKIAVALTKVAPEHLTFRFIAIDALPLYNQDLETNAPPAEWAAFRAALQACDAVLFATPEYNRSVPGVLKNAIDVGSRPPGKNSFLRRPAAVISVSPGKFGGMAANHHLRQSLVFLDMPVLQQPEAYIAGVADLLDAQGEVKAEATRDFLRSFIVAFADWIERTARD